MRKTSRRVAARMNRYNTYTPPSSFREALDYKKVIRYRILSYIIHFVKS